MVLITKLISYTNELMLFIKGWVTAVKNQGQCGSCAAFAAHALHEVSLVKAGAKLKGMDLSEQHLIDCAYNGE